MDGNNCQHATCMGRKKLRFERRNRIRYADGPGNQVCQKTRDLLCGESGRSQARAGFNPGIDA